MDFLELKAIARSKAIDLLDHSLHKRDRPSPRQDIARWIFESILTERENCRVYEVTVWETPTSFAKYRVRDLITVPAGVYLDRFFDPRHRPFGQDRFQHRAGLFLALLRRTADFLVYAVLWTAVFLLSAVALRSTCRPSGASGFFSCWWWSSIALHSREGVARPRVVRITVEGLANGLIQSGK